MLVVRANRCRSGVRGFQALELQNDPGAGVLFDSVPAGKLGSAASTPRARRYIRPQQHKHRNAILPSRPLQRKTRSDERGKAFGITCTVRWARAESDPPRALDHSRCSNAAEFTDQMPLQSENELARPVDRPRSSRISPDAPDNAIDNTTRWNPVHVSQQRLTRSSGRGALPCPVETCVSQLLTCSRCQVEALVAPAFVRHESTSNAAQTLSAGADTGPSSVARHSLHRTFSTSSAQATVATPHACARRIDLSLPHRDNTYLISSDTLIRNCSVLA